MTSKKEKYQQMLNFKRELLNKIKEPGFKLKIEKILNKVDFYKVKLTDRGFIFINTDTDHSILEISMTNTDVYYSLKKLFEPSISSGMYHIESSGKSYTKYVTIDETVYKNKINILYNLYDVKKEILFQCFDEFQNEIWYLEEIKQDNYYQNKINNERILTEPNHFENYLEKNYYFREKSGYIIKRFIKKYHNEDINSEIKDEDFYLVSRNCIPNNRILPRSGWYSGVSKEMIANYKLGKCDFEKVWQSRVKRKTTTTYF